MSDAWLDRLVRPSILRLQAYQSARSLTSPQKARDPKVYLDANEAADGVFNRYPQPQPPELLARFAALYSVGSQNILAGRGSDEAIDTLTRTFCEPKTDCILITPPTYGMYEVAANIQNAGVVRVPLVFSNQQWRLDVSGMTAAAQREKLKLVYVCSPNNPTGGTFPLSDLRLLCSSLKDQALLVVDEAYGEFAPSSSALPLLAEFRNLVVLRTLSKAWALAGLRCGVAIGDPALIQMMQKVRAPYPLPQPVIDFALRETEPAKKTEMLERVQRLSLERERLRGRLKAYPAVTDVYDSLANFLLVRFSNAAQVMEAMSEKGIVLRSRSLELGLDNCVRITVGTDAENDLMLSVLDTLSSTRSR